MNALADLDVEWSMETTLSVLKEGLAALKVDRSVDPYVVSTGKENLDGLELILKKLTEAEEYYRRPVDDPAIYKELYEIHAAMGLRDEAARFKARIARYEARKWEFQGRLLSFFGNDLRAMAYYRKALELTPDLEMALRGMEKAQKRVDRSRRELEKLARKAEANDTCKDRVAYARALMDIGDLEGARGALARALELDSGNTDALWRMGATYCLQADFDTARGYFEKALSIKENAMNPKRGLNYATYFMENRGEASELFREE